MALTLAGRTPRAASTLRCVASAGEGVVAMVDVLSRWDELTATSVAINHCEWSRRHDIQLCLSSQRARLVSMALRAARRNRLPASSFAYPRQRKYPIDTIGRARNALSRASQSNTFGTYSHVAKAVRRRYGNRVATVGPKKGTISGPGLRRRGQRRGR